MSRLQDIPAGSVASTHEGRLTTRRKLTEMAYVELTQDNGGILLNLSEGGLAVQCALALSSKEFPELRFQLPSMRGWLTVSGRVVWMSDSKKEAGIAFVDLQQNARAQIRHWVETGKDRHIASPHHENRNENREPKPPAKVATASNGDTGTRRYGGFSPIQSDLNSEPAAPAARNDTAPVPAQQNQNYTFHDYSMFSADPRMADLWIEPPKPRVKWGSLAFLGILIAALFFILGATIQHGEVDQLLAYVENWAATARQLSSSDTTTRSTAKSETPGPEAPVTNSDATPKPQSPPSSNAPSPQVADGQEKTEEQTAQPSSEQRNESEKTRDLADSTSDGPASPKTPGRPGRPGQPAIPTASRDEAVAARSPKVTSRDTYYAGTPAPDADTGQSILVNPPAPGNPPLFVTLPGEAISASSTVAITARRSIQVPARTDASQYGPERVVVGRLLAHSDPFYPLEARNKHLEGSVELLAVVGRTGQVIKVSPMSGPAPLVTAAVMALHEWRYEPTYVAGDPVETHADVTMVFRAH